jgi:hypothetical protein
MLSDPRLCQEMGLGGQGTAQTYNGDVLWPRNAKVFEQVTHSMVGAEAEDPIPGSRKRCTVE